MPFSVNVLPTYPSSLKLVAGVRTLATPFLSKVRQVFFPDLMRSVMEGLGFAAADCYNAMGIVPNEVRLSGGAAQSAVLRTIVSAAVGTSVRYSARAEAGAAGAAMMAAVSLGVYDSMDDCVDAWVNPLLSELEPPDSRLQELYQSLFPTYVSAREALEPAWSSITRLQEIGS